MYCPSSTLSLSPTTAVCPYYTENVYQTSAPIQIALSLPVLTSAPTFHCLSTHVVAFCPPQVPHLLTSHRHQLWRRQVPAAMTALTCPQHDQWAQENLPSHLQVALDTPFGNDSLLHTISMAAEFQHVLLFVFKSDFFTH